MRAGLANGVALTLNVTGCQFCARSNPAGGFLTCAGSEGHDSRRFINSPMLAMSVSLPQLAAGRTLAT